MAVIITITAGTFSVHIFAQEVAPTTGNYELANNALPWRRDRVLNHPPVGHAPPISNFRFQGSESNVFVNQIVGRGQRV